MDGSGPNRVGGNTSMPTLWMGTKGPQGGGEKAPRDHVVAVPGYQCDPREDTKALMNVECGT